MKDAGSNLDEIDTIGQVTMALSSVKNDVSAKLQVFEVKLNEQLEAKSEQMKDVREKRYAHRYCVCKVRVLENSLLDVQSGAGAEIERLQAHIDRLEASLQAASAPRNVEEEQIIEEEEEEEEVTLSILFRVCGSGYVRRIGCSRRSCRREEARARKSLRGALGARCCHSHGPTSCLPGS